MFVETKNSFVKKQMLFLKSGIRVGMEVTGGLKTFDLAPVSLILRRRKQSPIPNSIPEQTRVSLNWVGRKTSG